MSEQTEHAKTYKKTLNLPKTAFPMRANLVQNEPASLKRWGQHKLYTRLREARHPAGPYVFHDGPPYANGSIHLGHLLNKVLKDFVVRSHTMLGYDVSYIPGWDCHGLPIEHRVVQDLGPKARGMAPMQIRKRCRDYAAKYVKLQSRQFQQLLTLADYDKPYLTMDPAYEAAVLEVFADLVERGLVYRGLKPVHWSIENRTALAEAELEYHDREDTSVYVRFEVDEPSRDKLFDAFGITDSATRAQTPSLVIWTTTPWTLPANLAVAVNPRHAYTLARVDDRLLVVATELLEKVAGKAEATNEPLAQVKGDQLLATTYVHPFLADNRTRAIYAADYVTLEDGTGLVHIAPGHGTEDYLLGLEHDLPVYCPVLHDGTFDSTAPDWLQGLSVWQANDKVVEHLQSTAHLLHHETFTHSYPHDWRGKTPVIFRATEQWFISVDQPYSLPGASDASLRDRAMQHTDSQINFIPKWGRNRLHGMLQTRPDWCISRQRAWGLPIPVFYNEHGKPLLTPASVRAASQAIAQHGSDYWFTAEPAELLEHYDPASDPAAPDWAKAAIASNALTKGHDIFDVWFESGSSWHAVLRQRKLGYPADLYLEGSDQHRGWFQASLLPAVAATGQSPFKNLLTHGFMVDKHGRKMSKSIGNTLEVEDLLKNYGADVCRWWVASLNTESDIKVDDTFFKLAGENYRKVRNTIRFLLSNLSDFDATQYAYKFTEGDAVSIDAWALGELARLVTDVRTGYAELNFRRVHERLFHFCNETLSAVYLVAVKDRLYCDAADSRRRRRTQTALHRIADALVRLLAPLLPHTADEAWRALHGDDAEHPSVHLHHLPASWEIPVDEHWPQIMQWRDQWMRAIEEARQSLDVDNPLDLGLVVHADAEQAAILARFDPVDLADLCMLSRFERRDAEAPAAQAVDLRKEPRCERSWKRDGTVKQRSDGGTLTDRDAAALGLS